MRAGILVEIAAADANRADRYQQIPLVNLRNRNLAQFH